MNAIDLLKADHDRVESLFEKFKQNETGSNGALFRRIRDELETHTHIEEKIFYPAAMKRGKADLKKIIREGLEEHAQVKDLLADLGKMTSRNKQFNAKLKVVVENVEHHVEEEEGEMFPLAEDQFSDTQLEKLGAEMEAEKARFQKANGIKPSREPKPTSIVDKAIAAVTGIFTGTPEPKKSNGRAKAAGAKSNGKSNGGSTSKARAKTATSKKTAARSKPSSSKKTASRSRSSSAKRPSRTSARG